MERRKCLQNVSKIFYLSGWVEFLISYGDDGFRTANLPATNYPPPNYAQNGTYSQVSSSDIVGLLLLLNTIKLVTENIFQI